MDDHTDPPAQPPRQYEQLPDTYQPLPAQRGPVEEHRGLLQRVGGLVVAAGLLLLKFGKLLLVALKGGKFFGTVITMGASVAAYSLFYGWPFALGFVLLIFVHEFGHVLQIKREGIEFTGMTFVPFLGAFVTSRGHRGDPAQDARIALAGPFVGGLGALATYGLALQLDSQLLQALAYFGFFLNMINLAPIGILDGGRMAAVTSFRQWLFAIVAIVLLFAWRPNPGLLIVGLVSLFPAFHAWPHRHEGPGTPGAVSESDSALLFGFWLGMIAAFALLMHLSIVPRTVN